MKKLVTVLIVILAIILVRFVGENIDLTFGYILFKILTLGMLAVFAIGVYTIVDYFAEKKDIDK